MSESRRMTDRPATEAQSDAARPAFSTHEPAGRHLPLADPSARDRGGVHRRQFLEWMTAVLALSGTNGCRVSQPGEEIVPRVRSPEHTVPGRPKFYATALTLSGYATGVLVESHEGRPTRISGNPDHPASLGGLDAILQAAVLSLYDPDRSQAVTAGGRIRTWEACVDAVESVLRSGNGAGVRLLTGTVTSPTLARQMQRLREQYPNARWHHYEPVHRDAVFAGAELAFGKPLETRYDFERADVVCSLDADFVDAGPGHVRHARDFTSRRRVRAPGAAGDRPFNRLYSIETGFTPTGSMSDHRLPLPPHRVAAAARYLASVLGAETGEPHAQELDGDARAWLDAVADDLASGDSLIVAGPAQPARVHALVHRMNAMLGNVGRTVEYTEPVPASAVSHIGSLRRLLEDAEKGEVDLLLIAGGNPVFDAPADLPFENALRRIGLTLRLGLYEDETSQLCHWHIPAAHPLESWSDARAFDGTASIIQPLIEPLYQGKTIHELVSLLAGEPQRTSYDIVRQYWKSQHGGGAFEPFWRKSLHDGVVAGTRFEAVPVELLGEPNPARPADDAAIEEPGPDEIAVAVRPDPHLYDGRFANNAWLQELPRPITKLTWENAALISPATARQRGLRHEQLVELRHTSGSMRVPLCVVPGHADEALTLYLGYGRTHAGRVGNAAGVNIFPLYRSTNPGQTTVVLRPLAARHPLARTQEHHRMESRDLVRLVDDPARVLNGSSEADHEPHGHPSLYPEQKPRDGRYAWGMSIDLTACSGCNACVIACQSENNIPAVGRDEVLRGREMHWIRIDQYFDGEGAGTRSLHQPVTCMHCENAPCEAVCPVAATVHSSGGLNEMVYNRCVGTRYCSNNCPYKVRRFNFYHYASESSPVTSLLRNPDVTVRTRGVMEKCTYCVQRINAARIEASKEDRPIRDGEVVTACQSVCPTQAIEFGDTANADSRVSRRKAHPLDYGLLTELNTFPRTTYLPRVVNPNPALAPVRRDDASP